MKSILTLMALAIVVPELLTGSTPLSGFLNPGVLLFLFIGYGLAILVIREIAVRYNLGYFGIFLLGFAYSIINEGLLAKTDLLVSGLPIAQYDNYGYAFGLSIPWSFGIGLFHAVCSVLFPILAAHHLFPDRKDIPWLTKKKTVMLALLTIVFSTAVFFGEYRVPGTVPLYAELIFAVAVIGFVARRFKKGAEAVVPKLSWKLFWLGVSTFLFSFLLLTSLADSKVSVVLYFAAYVLGVWWYVRTLNKKFGVTDESLLVFILGVYSTVAGMGAILGATVGAPERILSGAVALILVVWWARRLIRKGRNERL